MLWPGKQHAAQNIYAKIDFLVDCIFAFSDLDSKEIWSRSARMIWMQLHIPDAEKNLKVFGKRLNTTYIHWLTQPSLVQPRNSLHFLSSNRFHHSESKATGNKIRLTLFQKLHKLQCTSVVVPSSYTRCFELVQ